MDAPWRIELFSGLRASQAGGPLPAERILSRFRTRKTGVLLAYLAFHLDRAHAREELIERLWPESEPEAGRNSLRVALSSLRRQLEPPGVPAGAVILSDRGGVRLNSIAVTTDVAAFEAARRAARTADGAARVDRLSEAVEIYTGPLLPGHYEDWILPERQRLAEAFQEALAALMTHLEEQGDLSRAIGAARRGVSVDPLREEVHQELIRLLAAAGQTGAALEQYHELARRLAAELGCAPSVETERAVQAIREATRRGPERRARPPIPEPAPGSAPAGVLPTGMAAFLLARIDRDTPGASATAAQSAARNAAATLRSLFRQSDGHEIVVASAGPCRIAFAFGRASSALAAAAAGLRACECRAPGTRPRMALCLGEVPEAGTVDRSPGLDRAGRLLSAARSGQLLLCEATAALLRGPLPGGARLIDRGLYPLAEQAPPERVFAMQLDGAPAAETQPAEPRIRGGNLPLQFTRFFGREEEIARLVELLQAGAAGGGGRVVTLTGPGGSGKTRLAAELVHRWIFGAEAGACPFETAWFVSLAEVAEPARILDAALDALRLPRASGVDPLEQVGAALARGRSLLLLDNVEHLAEGAGALLPLLLERAPRLVCLVTSRVRLDLPEEVEFGVAPLPVPAAPALPSSGSRVPGGETTNPEPGTRNPERLLAFPSVQLFVDRAQGVRPDFQVTPANAAAVAALCARLEGMPLALELAAARAWALTPAQMLAHLNRRFEFLVGRRRAAVPRHQTLRAAIETSYDLLPAHAQACFCRLAVFRGGWTLPAAEAVCDATGSGPSACDDLEELRRHSLVTAEETEAGTRYRMLETLREFAWDRLPPEERTALVRRHLEYFAEVATRTARELAGPGVGASWQRVEEELENIRAALDGADPEPGLRFCTALSGFWSARGSVVEGQGWMDRLLERARAAPPEAPGLRAARARALYAAALMASRQGDYAIGRERIAECLLLLRETGDRRLLAAAIAHLGNTAAIQGQAALAEERLAEALAIRESLGLPHDLTLSHISIAEAAIHRGDHDAARARLLPCLAAARERQELHTTGYILNCLGDVARGCGEPETARACYEEALAILRGIGDAPCSACSLHGLACLAADRGERGEALRLHRESLRIRRKLGAKLVILESIEGTADTLSRAGATPEQAARLLGAAEALRETLAVPVPPHRLPAHRAQLDALRNYLGDVRFESLRAAGRALTWQKAVAEALGESDL